MYSLLMHSLLIESRPLSPGRMGETPSLYPMNLHAVTILSDLE